MKKANRRLSWITMTAMLASLSAAPALALTPLNTANSSATAMYVTNAVEGGVVPVNIDPCSTTHPERLDATNVYGNFDATSEVGVNEKFFALASRTWTKFTFGNGGERFQNVDGVSDIKFSEVTWGSWHSEGALVYLTGVILKDGSSYTDNDSNAPNAPVKDIQGQGSLYYAGIAANKVAINGLTSQQKTDITNHFLPTGVTRTFGEVKYVVESNLGYTEFNLPDEVKSADGIIMVDVTGQKVTDDGTEYYKLGTGSLFGTYININGPKDGKKLTYVSRQQNSTAPGNDSVTADIVPGYDGNTDGYDLDAIRVFKCAPAVGGDSATGYSKTNGEFDIISDTDHPWFMYNTIDLGQSAVNSSVTFNIQAGNPVNGTHFIGTCTVTKVGTDQYVVTYDMNDTTTIGGYVYNIAVTNEHLGIDHDPPMDLSHNPGDYQENKFGEPFVDDDGFFYVFAHFEVQYN